MDVVVSDGMDVVLVFVDWFIIVVVEMYDVIFIIFFENMVFEL